MTVAEIMLFTLDGSDISVSIDIYCLGDNIRECTAVSARIHKHRAAYTPRNSVRKFHSRKRCVKSRICNF